MEKIEKIGEMRFCLDDYRETEFNESVDCTFGLWGNQRDSEILSIEKYYCLCKDFASAMGFADQTINEWFGEY